MVMSGELPNKKKESGWHLWLFEQLTLGGIPGLQWIDKNEGLIGVKWVHAARATYDKEECGIFERWTIHPYMFRMLYIKTSTSVRNLPRKHIANIKVKKARLIVYFGM